MTYEEWKFKLDHLGRHISGLKVGNEYTEYWQREYDWLLKQKPEETVDDFPYDKLDECEYTPLDALIDLKQTIKEEAQESDYCFTELRIKGILASLDDIISSMEDNVFQNTYSFDNETLADAAIRIAKHHSEIR